MVEACAGASAIDDKARSKPSRRALVFRSCGFMTGDLLCDCSLFGLFVSLLQIHCLLTVPSSEFATQMKAPSKATPHGRVPTGKVPRLAPSAARSSVTVLLPEFVTQTLAPSKATPTGADPTANVPNTTPSLARTLVTL